MKGIKDIAPRCSSLLFSVVGISEEEVLKIVESKIKKCGLNVVYDYSYDKDDSRVPSFMWIKLELLDDLTNKGTFFVQLSVRVEERAYFIRSGEPVFGEVWSNKMIFFHHNVGELREHLLEQINKMLDNFSKDFLSFNRK